MRNRLAVFLAVASLLVASGAPRAAEASGTTGQTIEWTPPYTASVGATITLVATASSTLTVAFTTGDAAICEATGTNGAQLVLIAAGDCVVTASQAGDETYAPVSSQWTVVVRPGFHVEAFAVHDGVVRTDGAIQVGDTLTIRVPPIDGVAVTSCDVRVSTPGGGGIYRRMAGAQDGSCGLTMTLPALLRPSERGRMSAGPSGYDVCASIIAGFADRIARAMSTGDRLLPAGRDCGGTYDVDDVADFLFDGTGERTAFTSVPHVLSWDPRDWYPAYQPLQFGSPWTVQFPDWVTWCDGAELNGEGPTYIKLPAPSDCQAGYWLTLPGVLPATYPWTLNATWSASAVFSYEVDGQFGMTLAGETPTLAPSRTPFAASEAGIFPTDLAVSRFVTLGDRWQPRFRAVGPAGGPVPAGWSCRIRVLASGSDPAWPGGDAENLFADAALDESGECGFDLRTPYTTIYARNQWVIMLLDDQGAVVVSMGQVLVPVPAPVVPVLTDLSGDTGVTGTDVTIDTVPGTDLGLGFETAIASEVAPAALTGSWQGPATTAAVAVATTCSEVTLAEVRENGQPGTLDRSTATCTGLPDGTYRATTTKVDVTGKVRGSSLTFAVTSGTATLLERGYGSTVAITDGTLATPSTVGQSYEVSGTIGGAGYVLPSGSVAVSDGSGGACVAAITEGTWACALTSTTPGVLTLAARYGGDAVHAPATSLGVNHEVIGLVPVITYTGATTTTVGTPYTVSASLRSPTGKGLRARSLTFRLSSGEELVATTNNAGTASATAAAPLVAGAVDVDVDFAGGPPYLPASASAAVDVLRRSTSLTYTGPTGVRAATSFLATAVLRSASRKGVPGETVTFTLGSAPAVSGVTDLTGTASATLTVPLAAGRYALVVTYEGSGTYAPSTVTTSVTFRKIL